MGCLWIENSRSFHPWLLGRLAPASSTLPPAALGNNSGSLRLFTSAAVCACTVPRWPAARVPPVRQELLKGDRSISCNCCRLLRTLAVVDDGSSSCLSVLIGHGSADVLLAVLTGQWHHHATFSVTADFVMIRPRRSIWQPVAWKQETAKSSSRSGLEKWREEMIAGGVDQSRLT